MTPKQLLFVACGHTEGGNSHRWLDGMPKKCVTVCADNSTRALEKLAGEHFDAIVVAVSPPLQETIRFLNEASRLAPKSLQFVLVESTDRPKLEKQLSPGAHYLPVSYDPVRLAAAIERNLQLARWMENPKIRPLLGQVRELASLPTLYREILERLHSPEAHITDIAALMSQDPAICAKMLKVANSAFFSLPREICDGFEAVMLLGLERTKALVLMTHYLSMFELPANAPFSVDAFWTHSMATASFAWSIVQRETADTQRADEAFTGGLLHDLGKLILISNTAELYGRAVALAAARDLCSWEAEQEVFGVTHEILGACLLGTWGLPLVLLEAIASHHHPCEHVGNEFTLLTAVHVADALAYEKTAAFTAKHVPQVDFEYLYAIGMDNHYAEWREACLHLFGNTESEVKNKLQPLVPHAAD